MELSPGCCFTRSERCMHYSAALHAVSSEVLLLYIRKIVADSTRSTVQYSKTKVRFDRLLSSSIIAMGHGAQGRMRPTTNEARVRGP
jgi:hypothetical protein